MKRKKNHETEEVKTSKQQRGKMKGGQRGEGGTGGGYIGQELVLLGGGHAHLFVLKMWGMKPLDHVRLTLISSDVDTPYSGMIPGMTTTRQALILARLSIMAHLLLVLILFLLWRLMSHQ